MRIQRCDRFLEVGRSLEHWSFELDAPRIVVQMDTENLGRVAWRQVRRLRIGDVATIAKQKAITFGTHPLRLSLVQDSPPFLSRAVKYTHWLFSDYSV